MKSTHQILLLALVACSSLASCKVGKDRVLFVTRTGIALDVDSAPATLNLGYERQELTIAPTFEQGQVLPVMSTVGGSAKGLSLQSAHSFGTGTAVMVLADALLSEERYEFDRATPLTVGSVPEPGMVDLNAPAANDSQVNPWSGVVVTQLQADDRMPFFFGTDTSLGAKISFEATGLPSAGSVGYKRKELALVPLIESKRGEYMHIALPSLLAIANVEFGSENKDDAGAKVGQVYATGAAATLLATHHAVRSAISPALVGDAVVAGEKVEAEKKTLESQKTLLTTINTKFGALGDTNQTLVVKKAEEMKLANWPIPTPDDEVPDDATKRDQLIGQLGQSMDLQNEVRTAEFRTLLDFIETL